MRHKICGYFEYLRTLIHKLQPISLSTFCHYFRAAIACLTIFSISNSASYAQHYKNASHLINKTERPAVVIDHKPADINPYISETVLAIDIPADHAKTASVSSIEQLPHTLFFRRENKTQMTFRGRYTSTNEHSLITANQDSIPIIFIPTQVVPIFTPSIAKTEVATITSATVSTVTQSTEINRRKKFNFSGLKPLIFIFGHANPKRLFLINAYAVAKVKSPNAHPSTIKYSNRNVRNTRFLRPFFDNHSSTLAARRRIHINSKNILMIHISSGLFNTHPKEPKPRNDVNHPSPGLKARASRNETRAQITVNLTESKLSLLNKSAIECSSVKTTCKKQQHDICINNTEKLTLPQRPNSKLASILNSNSYDTQLRYLIMRLPP